MSGDTTPASLIPVALLNNHNIYLDFASAYIFSQNFSYAFPFVQNHYVSLFPIVTPVLVTPVYAISAFLSIILGSPVFGGNSVIFLSKSAASAIAALAGVFVYLSGKELFSKRIATLTTFIFAFATSTWSISSQALWQHGTVELFLAALFYLMIKNEKTESWRYIFLMGILSGLFVFNRPPDSLLIIPVIFYILWIQRARIHYYLIGGILGGLPFFWYNYSIFGNIFGGYAQNLSLFAVNAGFIGNYLGLLIAPNVGLFIFCPILLLSIAGFYGIYINKDSHIRTLLLVAGIAVILEVLLYSFFTQWSSSAAYCFGPRFLTGLIPILCIYTGFFLNKWFGTGKVTHFGQKKWIAITIIGALIISSVCIQIIGVFFYKFSSKSNMSMNDERAWDVSDSLIVRSAIEGTPKVSGIMIFILPPLPPVIEYDFVMRSGVG
ncbi:MAG: glycosyltransferase family 39 protein [Methanoregula sp.]